MWASCLLRSKAHIIKPDSLRLLQSTQSNVRALRVDNHRIRAYVRSPMAEGNGAHAHYGHHAIKALVLSLNMGTIGHFYWEDDSSAHPTVTLSNDLDVAEGKKIALVTHPPTVDYGHLREFSSADEYRSALLFGVFARGSAHVLEDEYCRGLLLFNMQFYDIDFRRDAFMCFYRVLEHFVTRRVLGKPRLQNELKDIQSCLTKMGFDEALTDEMRQLYMVRSSQTAHAQSTQRTITTDEVMKMKVFVDALLAKTLLVEADGIMEQLNAPSGVG